ncbi:hypothetical protein GGX14DRAFT_449604 [Mycena pura]|uniref:S5 DRBM domain-containing protein n=1 Tax=Mycena pura TaxID=153505 RepID=A0AAD6YDV4_9AGAR|nr:hypothetical protein GGX14DRAFT_449604 [Mycena pura]
MNLARLVRRRPPFATRRVLAAPRLRPYSSQTPTHESLYAQYVQDLKSRGPSVHPPPEPVSFEKFKEILATPHPEKDILNLTDAVESSAGTSGGTDTPLDRYDSILAALAELEASDPNFSETLANFADDIKDRLEDRGIDPVFQERLEDLAVENSSENEVAMRVAQLVMSTTEKWALEKIEDKLATYNGPLSRLNVVVEWYLEHPDQIDLTHIQDSTAAETDNNSYYYQDTPVDELARHLRDRDVQYAIKRRMDWKDREELFRLLDSLVTPVFKEDMNVLNAIAAIFAKYEDVHLVYTSEPRLPRIRRLDVFKRLLPRPDDENPSKQEEDETEIGKIVAEKKKLLEIVEAEKLANRQPWPNLMTRDPLLDSREVLELPPTKENPFHNRVVIRNHHSIFTEALHADGFDFNNPNYEPTKTDDVEEVNSDAGNNLPIDPQDPNLIIYPVIGQFATRQTPKGRRSRFVKVVIVGDGNGMVGIGFGKHETPEKAYGKGVADAIRNMDWVERFEDRTIWTEVRTKFGATVVILRPRPAAGIKDISAKVWGSRNRIGVLKATLRLLQAGHTPLGMGDGVGGPGRKMHKGTGLRNKSQIERERGRRLIDLKV